MLNETLRLLRIFHDEKSNELARKLDISAAYLSKIESNKISPSVEIIEKYANVFKTTPSSILLFSEKLDNKKKRGPFKISIRNKLFYLLQSLESLKNDHSKNISNK